MVEVSLPECDEPTPPIGEEAAEGVLDCLALWTPSSPRARPSWKAPTSSGTRRRPYGQRPGPGCRHGYAHTAHRRRDRSTAAGEDLEGVAILAQRVVGMAEVGGGLILQRRHLVRRGEREARC